VPDETSGLFYVRAASAEDLAPLKKRVQACFEAGALATGCTAEIKWAKADYLDLKTSMPIADAYEANARSLGRDFFPLSKQQPATSPSKPSLPWPTSASVPRNTPASTSPTTE